MGTTLIDHKIRVKLKLNCLEYCVADYIYKDVLANQTICTYLCISMKQLIEIHKSLFEKGIIQNERDYFNKLTDKWKNEFKKYNDLKKEVSIEQKIILFHNSIIKIGKQYTVTLLEEFFNYWSELNKSKTKMRWELEKTWDLSKRLARWYNNNNKKSPEIKKDNVTYIIK